MSLSGLLTSLYGAYVKLERFFVFIVAAIVGITLYITTRIVFFCVTQCMWYETIAAALFLAAELFILMHSITYFFNVLAALKLEKLEREFNVQTNTYPPVAVVLCSYKEPLELIERGLICMRNLEYPNKQLYLLDDTPYDRQWDSAEVISAYKQSVEAVCKKVGVSLFRRKWRGAKAGMINDFLDYLVGLPHLGSQLFAFYRNPTPEKPKYLVVFDVDMNPLPTFLQHVVPIVEGDSNLAFVQTPQYYTNINDNHMANAAGIQQVVFYEYICKGKSLDKAVFCCGTNVILRISAILEVGGMDETCVTEDFATSLNMHMKGWDSAYLGKILCFGNGPTDLRAYLSQQNRWAHGTLDVGRKTVFEFFKNRSRLPAAKWWSYFISCSYYLSAIAFVVLLTMPCLYIFFDIRSYLFNPYVYMVICIPYLSLSLSSFVCTLTRQKYKLRHVLITMIMMAITFPQIMRASIRGLMKKELAFLVTPKDKGIFRFRLRELWPQILSCVVCASAVTWGILRSHYGDEPFFAILFNVIWLVLHIITVAPIIYFNNPEDEFL